MNVNFFFILLLNLKCVKYFIIYFWIAQRRILIDTGDEHVPEYIKNLKNVLNEEKIKLDHLIITHWHHDHIGGLVDIAEKIGKGWYLNKKL